MEIVMTIIIGFVVGLLARAIMPGRQRIGIILTTLLGIVGALVATYGGQALGIYRAGQSAGIIASVVGALVVLWAYTTIAQRR